MRYLRTIALLLVTILAGSAFAETRSVTVPVASQDGSAVPVSVDLLTLRNAIGADFAFDWANLRVSVAGEPVAFQIDDVDLNERVSAGDELAFLAAADATIEASDTALEPVAFEPGLEVSVNGDASIITSLSGNGFSVEIAPEGLARITGFGDTQGVLAAELGILRFSGYPDSTWWADEQYGPHEEYTTLEAGGMRHVQTQILAAGPVRVVAVSEYASDRFVGLSQRVVTRVYQSGDVDVSNSVRFGGYSDMMKLQSMATNMVSQVDPEALHVAPVFRRLLWADQLDITAEEYFAERDAVRDVDGESVIAFNSTDNLSPLYWGAAYIFTSAEPWRAGYSESLGLTVIESAHSMPAIADDYDEWLAGNTWVFESQEFRTGVFKWSAEEFATYPATEGITLNVPNHYLPGDTAEFRFTYSVRAASDLEDAVRQARSLQAAIAGATLE
ncbi:MAG TPA: hypothetical protein VFD39_10140 [Trueperaceae bacterium]|nr:hypothetical protein [Trueperaceae bacterium]